MLKRTWSLKYLGSSSLKTNKPTQDDYSIQIEYISGIWTIIEKNTVKIEMLVGDLYSVSYYNVIYTLTFTF